MGNKKNMIAILGIGLLLIFAYAIPGVVTAIEDRHLQSQTHKFEIEEIKLNSGEKNLTEKLSVFQRLSASDIVVQHSQAEPSKESDTIEKKTEEFLSILSEKKEISFREFVTTPLVLADSDSGKVYFLRECYAMDENKNEYAFWVDEETEIVLAFEVPYAMIQPDFEEFYEIGTRLSEYYGFAGGEFVGDKTVVVQEQYWETAFWFVDEANEEVKVMLYKNGETLSFNMYPDNKSVYDKKTDDF